MQSKRTTGLSPEQFAVLLDMMAEKAGSWDSRCGRPRALSFPKAVKATVMYFKNNLTQDVIAELLGVGQPTISRVIAELEPVIAGVLEPFVPGLPAQMIGRVGIVDGSLLPCWSWNDADKLYSGKHKTTGHNCQFVCDLFGRLLFISAPLPGSVHDAKAFTQAGLTDLMNKQNAIGDKGYLGCGITTPFRKPQDGELTDWQKEFNTSINKIRYVIERAIANFKTWRSMHTDYRRPLRTIPTAFQAIRALHFYKLQAEF